MAGGYALGSSLENSVAIDGDAILNPEGLRYADEFVRHKALDAVGDLSLAGAPIIGLYRTYRPGHKLNAMALEALFDHRSAYEILEALGRPRSGRGCRRRACACRRRGFRPRRLNAPRPAAAALLPAFASTRIAGHLRLAGNLARAPRVR